MTRRSEATRVKRRTGEQNVDWKVSDVPSSAPEYERPTEEISTASTLEEDSDGLVVSARTKRAVTGFVGCQHSPGG